MTPEAQEKLDQYITKAMLLGMLYDPRDHTFNRYGPVHNITGGKTIEAMISADSLDGVTHPNKVDDVPQWLGEIPYSERVRIWNRLWVAHKLP